MWILSWKKYKLSKTATFLSIVGALVRYGGVLSLFAMLIPAAIICIAIGCGFHFWAESINFKAWVKLVRSKGLEDEVKKGNVNVAMQLLKAYPGKQTKKYLSSLNESVASAIDQQTPQK